MVEEKLNFTFSTYIEEKIFSANLSKFLMHLQSGLAPGLFREVDQGKKNICIIWELPMLEKNFDLAYLNSEAYINGL